MRVAYLTSQYPAPSHTFILREVEALRAHGIDLQTFSIRRPSTAEVMSDRDRHALATTWYALPAKPLEICRAIIWVSFTRPLGVLRILGTALQHRPPGLRSFLFAIFYWIEAIMLCRVLERRGIEHLHNHFANPAAIVGLLATRLIEIPWSLTLHGISEFDYPAGLLLPEKINAAKFVACVSHFGRAQAFRVTDPSQWDKLIIVRCGIDLSEFSLDPIDKPQARPRIICIGRLSPEKGHMGLLRAFAQQRKAGLDAALCLVGDGPERQRINQEIIRLGLEDDCELLGIMPTRQVLLEIQKCDLLVMASFMEGLPIVLMEALGLGVAVVAPCVAGIPELVSDDCGLMFSPGNWDELGTAMSQLITDPERRKILGKVGRKRIEDEYDIKKAVKPLLRHFASQ